MWFAAFVLTILSVVLSISIFQSPAPRMISKLGRKIYQAILTNSKTPSTASRPFPFLRLPPEIRLQIYRHALPQHKTIILTQPSAPFCPFPPSSPLPVFIPAILLRLHSGCPCQTKLTPPFLPLLQVSRLLRHEAQPIFYSNNAFVLNIDMPKTLLCIPDLLSLFEYGRINGGDILDLIKDFRIRVAGNVMVDVCGPEHRWKRYGGRVLVASKPSDEITGMLRAEENIPECVGKVLEGIGERSGVNVDVVRQILDEVFWNWEEKP